MIQLMSICPRAGVAAVLLFVASSAGLVPRAVSAAEPPKTATCSAAPFQQFDFWVGDWDAFDVGKPDAPVARTHVSRILDGCVLLEVYEGADGHIGQSFSIYDASRKVWHQSWVTNRGELLVLEGTRKGNRIVFEGDSITAKGKQRTQVFWEPQGADVRETATVSDDGGKSWKPLFDIVFRKHKD